jgi:hypothetical protein
MQKMEKIQRSIDSFASSPRLYPTAATEAPMTHPTRTSRVTLDATPAPGTHTAGQSLSNIDHDRATPANPDTHPTEESFETQGFTTQQDLERLADLAKLTEDSYQPELFESWGYLSGGLSQELVCFAPPLPEPPPRKKRWPRKTATAFVVLTACAISFSAYALGRLQGDGIELPPRQNATIASMADLDEQMTYYPSLKEPTTSPEASTTVTTVGTGLLQADGAPRPRSFVAAARTSENRTATSRATRARRPRSPHRPSTSEQSELSRMLDDVLGGSRATATESLPAAPTRAQVLSGLRGAATQVGLCGGYQGRLTVDVTIHGPSGRVSAVELVGNQGSSTESCVRRALMRASFPRFTDPSFEVKSFPYVSRLGH